MRGEKNVSFYDDDYFSEEELFYEENTEKPEKAEKPDPGTRIIYQAPQEKSAKTVYVDYSGSASVKRDTPVSQHSYKGGFAFEQELRDGNSYPQRRSADKSVRSDPEKRARELQEEKKRRYLDSLSRVMDEELETEYLLEQEDIEEIELSPDDYIRRTPNVRYDRTAYIKDKYRGIHEDALTTVHESKSNKAEIARKIVLVISVIAMLASITVLVKQYIQRKQVEDWQNEVTGLLIDEPTEGTTKKNKNNKKNNKTTEATSTTKPLTVEEQWAQLKKDYPGVTFPEGLSLKYAKLYAVNRDFVGYISIDSLGVGLPVVQSSKDTETDNYYLRKSFYKKYSVYGCPFVPKSNNMKNLDRNTVIYGHNNNSNLAFAPINKYKTVDGFKKAPVIQFDTLYGTYKWKIIAAFITNTVATDDNDYIFNYTFTKMKSNDDFAEYVEELKQRSLYDTGVDVKPSDKILTLSTCTHDFDNARFVVVARLVRAGESDKVNTSKAVKNKSPRYPQAYYDVNNKDNPYIDAKRWFYKG